MNLVKQAVKTLTGYWVHKLATLPIGADLFFDISERLKYGYLGVVFDVGANEGQTYRWVKHHQPAAKLYCFEPVRSTYDKLIGRFGNDAGAVFEQMALGETKGEQRIKLFSDYSVLNSLRNDLMNQDKNAKAEVIRVDTLDAYCLSNNIKRIDLLKIDTEGYELSVLKGAERMLDERKISFVYCEVGFMKSNNRNTYFAELTEYLAAKNYFFYSLYQLDAHDWHNGNHLGNALFINRDIYPG
jgi:FkbM family methyltransferase